MTSAQYLGQGKGGRFHTKIPCMNQGCLTNLLQVLILGSSLQIVQDPFNYRMLFKICEHVHVLATKMHRHWDYPVSTSAGTIHLYVDYTTLSIAVSAPLEVLPRAWSRG